MFREADVARAPVRKRARDEVVLAAVDDQRAVLDRRAGAGLDGRADERVRGLLRRRTGAEKAGERRRPQPQPCL